MILKNAWANACCNASRRALAYHLASSENSEVSGFLVCAATQTSRRPLGNENSHFFMWLFKKNGCLNGWWVRIWIGAGGEPSCQCAEECLDLFQNVILLSWEPSLRVTADSLVLQKSEKVPPDVWFYLWTFLCCPDETLPTCCRSFLFTLEWSL